VGLEHARRGRPTKDDAALVIGCGAIGLGVIAGLRLMGIAPIVAADFHPGRRELAIAIGAHIAVDPREVSPYAPLPDFGNRQVNLIYECVGQKGMLQRIIEATPFDGRIVMGGYCMEEEVLFVFAAQNKRLNVQFAAGEEPQDMELALRSIADGRSTSRPGSVPRHRAWGGREDAQGDVRTARAGTHRGRPESPVTPLLSLDCLTLTATPPPEVVRSAAVAGYDSRQPLGATSGCLRRTADDARARSRVPRIMADTGVRIYSLEVCNLVSREANESYRLRSSSARVWGLGWLWPSTFMVRTPKLRRTCSRISPKSLRSTASASTSNLWPWARRAPWRRRAT
jgi:hypothetical protein